MATMSLSFNSIVDTHTHTHTHTLAGRQAGRQTDRRKGTHTHKRRSGSPHTIHCTEQQCIKCTSVVCGCCCCFFPSFAAKWQTRSHPSRCHFEMFISIVCMYLCVWRQLHININIIVTNHSKPMHPTKNPKKYNSNRQMTVSAGFCWFNRMQIVEQIFCFVKCWKFPYICWCNRKSHENV